MEILHHIIAQIVEIIHQLGYIWIFVWMFLESSFFPFPSEVIIVPAWYLAYLGKMNLFLVILVWLIWSLAWSWFNYILASKLWRKYILKLISERKLNKIDNFFSQHWHISTFTWRLIPVLRQYISFPAWLAKMDKVKFTFYTALWAWIWITILALLGYFIWANQNLIHQYLKKITIYTIISVVILVIIYIWFNRKNFKN